MTIGICTVAYGSTYHGFLPEWSKAVASLETKPTTVTIIHDGVPQQIKDIVNDNIPVMWVEDHATTYTFHPQVLINTAISFTKCDWIVKLDADDLILPHALNGLRDVTADVWNFGYRINGNDVVSRSVNTDQVLQRSGNLISSCSPFRRWLWESNEFRDMPHCDWMFWIHAARSGAQFDSTKRVDYIYRVHPDQITNKIDRASAAARIRSL